MLSLVEAFIGLFGRITPETRTLKTLLSSLDTRHSRGPGLVSFD